MANVAIWERKNKEGDVFYNFTHERWYKGRDGKSQYTASLNEGRPTHHR